MISIIDALVKSEKNIQNFNVAVFINGVMIGPKIA